MTKPELYNHDAEEALAGAALLDNSVFTLADVQPDDFHLTDIRALWKEGQRLVMDSKGVDLITISDDVIRAIGGAVRYGNLINNCPSCTRYADYASIVCNLAEQRRLLAAASDLGKASYIADQDERREQLEKTIGRLQRIKEEYSHDGHEDEAWLLSSDLIMETQWPEPVWAIPGLLPAGLCILAGKPKLGKSWLALQIAQSISTGGVALGQKVEQGPILYLALEDPTNRIKGRMARQNWPKGATADFVTIDKGFGERIGDLSKGGGERVAQLIQQHNYRLVVIDTLSRAITGDQNDADRMTRALEPIQIISHQYNCVILLLDHHTKGAGIDTDMVADILGSTAKGAMADCIWSLYRERGKAGAKLSITGREVVEQTLQLTMDWQTGCWQLDSDTTKQSQRIIAVLQRLGPSKAASIVSALGEDRSNTYRRLQDLVNAGVITRRTDEDDNIWYEYNPSLL